MREDVVPYLNQMVEKNASHLLFSSGTAPFFFFFNDTATTEIYTAQYTLSLHDALPISQPAATRWRCWTGTPWRASAASRPRDRKSTRLNSSHIEPTRMPSSARQNKNYCTNTTMSEKAEAMTNPMMTVSTSV